MYVLSIGRAYSYLGIGHFVADTLCMWHVWCAAALLLYGLFLDPNTIMGPAKFNNQTGGYWPDTRAREECKGVRVSVCGA